MEPMISPSKYVVRVGWSSVRPTMQSACAQNSSISEGGVKQLYLVYAGIHKGTILAYQSALSALGLRRPVSQTAECHGIYCPAVGKKRARWGSSALHVSYLLVDI